MKKIYNMIKHIESIDILKDITIILVNLNIYIERKEQI